MSIGRATLVGFAAALVLWSLLAWFWVVMTGSAHVCSILQAPAAVGERSPRPMTAVEQLEYANQRCGPRPSLGVILVFGAGYVLIIGAIAARVTRPSD